MNGDQSAQGILSPFLRSRRIKAALPLIAGRVLDLGSGSGELARHVAPENYVGVDISAAACTVAARRFPLHRFQPSVPPGLEFDTIALLAVIEHVPDPAGFLMDLRAHLAPGGRMVLTTPHPIGEVVHTVGARLGLFSHDASEEHHDLIDQGRMRAIARLAGLDLLLSRRFLFGFNQIFVLGDSRND